MYEKFAKELATVLYRGWTEDNIIPVITGRAKAPKKSSSHIRQAAILKSSRKGTGRATTVPKNIAKLHIPRAEGEL